MTTCQQCGKEIQPRETFGGIGENLCWTCYAKGAADTAAERAEITSQIEDYEEELFSLEAQIAEIDFELSKLKRRLKELDEIDTQQPSAVASPSASVGADQPALWE